MPDRLSIRAPASVLPFTSLPGPSTGVFTYSPAKFLDAHTAHPLCVSTSQGKKYEQRRVLLAQIREKELEKGEQRRLEISEYKEVCHFFRFAHVIDIGLDQV
jgi:hypothetical protein